MPNPLQDFVNGEARTINDLLDLAETAPPVSVRYAGGDRENPRVTPAPPPTACISLNREMMPAAKAPTKTGVSYGGLQPGKTGEVIPLSAALMRESVFCRAGGHLIIDEPVPLVLKEQAGRESRDVFVERPRQLRVITPLQFAKQTAGGEEAAISAWPAVSSDAVGGLTSAEPGSKFMDTFLARVRLTRRQQALLPRELWAYEVSVALAAGLARLADSVALGRLENSLTAAAFAWSWAASKGIDHDSLAAIIGRDGTGAQVRAGDGVLTCNNICNAALTPTMASTLVGDWSRAAVFVANDAVMTAKRDGVNGDVDVSAVVSLRFECPDLTFFQRVSA